MLAKAKIVPVGSPFRVKGWGYADTLALLDERVPGGVRSVIDRMDPALRAFLSQTFFADVFYDVVPWSALLEESAARLGVNEERLVEEVSRHRAERDMTGINRLLLRFASPEKILDAAPRLAGRYFDFVRSTIDVRRPGCYELTTHGIPKILTDTYLTVTRTFLTHTLTLAGARNARHTVLSSLSDGTREGWAMVRVRRRVEWDAR